MAAVLVAATRAAALEALVREADWEAPVSFADRAVLSVLLVSPRSTGWLERTASGVITVIDFTIVIVSGADSASLRPMVTPTTAPAITITPGVGPATTTAVWRPTKDGPVTVGDFRRWLWRTPATISYANDSRPALSREIVKKQAVRARAASIGEHNRETPLEFIWRDGRFLGFDSVEWLVWLVAIAGLAGVVGSALI